MKISERSIATSQSKRECDKKFPWKARKQKWWSKYFHPTLERLKSLKSFMITKGDFEMREGCGLAGGKIKSSSQISPGKVLLWEEKFLDDLQNVTKTFLTNHCDLTFGVEDTSLYLCRGILSSRESSADWQLPVSLLTSLIHTSAIFWSSNMHFDCLKPHQTASIITQINFPLNQSFDWSPRLISIPSRIKLALRLALNGVDEMKTNRVIIKML